MMKNTVIRKFTLGILFATSPAFILPAIPAEAAESSQQDIEAQIAEQQRILDELNEKRKNAKTDELKAQITDLKQQMEAMRKKNNFDSQGAFDGLSMQLENLQRQLDEQEKTQKLLMETIKKLDAITTVKPTDEYIDSFGHKKYTANINAPMPQKLVNPGPQGNVSYTQDAKNAQNDSTMVFSFAPDQLYKIYCRTGYLTDIELHRGEKVSFVGGGDTSAWAINSTTVVGTPHIYIKPIVKTSTTNIIITTDKRSYQLIVCTSDWYNPMVRWVYGQEEHELQIKQAAKDDATITDKLNVLNPENLNFGYNTKVKGSAKAPKMVFDDGEKTYIRFEKTTRKLPALFIREKGHKTVSLANFKVRHNTYILDRLIDAAELRFNETDSVSITREK